MDRAENTYNKISKGNNERSWFIVFNNPSQHGYSNMTPREICQEICNKWCTNHSSRAAIALYCISSEGSEHIHAVLEDKKKARFSSVRKC